MTLAHGAPQGGVAIEFLLLGLAFLAAAFFFRPSQAGGNARTAVLCLVIGVAVLVGSFAVPRLSGDDHASEARVEIVLPEDDAELAAGQPVRIEVDLTGGTIARSASATSGGHMHLYVDDELQAMPYSLKTQATMDPGEHTVRVEYVDVDHISFDPPVEDEVRVTVR